MENLEETLKEERAKATKVCAEASSDEAWDAYASSIKCSGPDDAEQISKELHRAQARVGEEEQNVGMSFEELTEAVAHAKHKFETVKEKFKAVQEMLLGLKEAGAERRFRFDKMCTRQAADVSQRFNGYMGRKSHSGKLRVDYEKQELHVEISMAHHGGGTKKATATSDTRALSGGERSFATMAFTLALGDSTESPLRAMDEFDVFMDAVNRRISMQALLEFAKANGRQFIFLTPHDVSEVVGGTGVKVQTLHPARP